MHFHSDNETGVAAAIFDAIAAANAGPAMPYGQDALTRNVESRLCEVFEHELSLFLVASGTAANALALSALTPPYGAIYCHRDAHILVDECAAPEFFSGGARLIPLDGANGKLDAESLDARLAVERNDVHYVKPSVLSLTQATEWGTVYTLDELARLSAAAHRHGLGVHMDGTRFANAATGLGCSPAAMSWQAGIDVLCFGASKNGAMAAEAILFFDPALAADFALRRKRGGHLLSKQRFLAAQFQAYLENARWQTYAGHANRMAQRLGEVFSQLDAVELAYPIEANLVFVRVEPGLRAHLHAAGYQLNEWRESDGRYVLRLVAAFDTTDAQIQALAEVLAGT